MKICIWCRRTESEETFNKRAHTVPDSLGGQHICENVCDKCNAFFGTPQPSLPAIETALKEGLNLSRFRFLNNGSPLKKGHSAGRYKSTYFDANFRVKRVRLKPAYSLRPHFQEKLTRQFKRGIYKIYLEETERQRGNGLDERFNFIREFARFDLNDLPVLHFERTHGALMYHENLFSHPQLAMQKNYRSKYLLEEYGFFEFEIVGHVFSIATSKLWHLNFNQYARKSMEAKAKIFRSYRVVKTFDDIDLGLMRTFAD